MLMDTMKEGEHIDPNLIVKQIAYSIQTLY